MSTDVPSSCPCDLTCSMHFTAQTSRQHIPSPYPHLLSTTAGPSSDAEAAVLLAAVERAGEEISRLDEALERLHHRQKELDAFAKTHRAVLSVLRRVPDEILLEIFQHLLTPTRELDSSSTAPWVVGRVCRRWRIVALTSPRLWRHFNLPDLRIAQSRLLSTVLPVQLERARGTPISIEFGRFETFQPIIDFFLCVITMGGPEVNLLPSLPAVVNLMLELDGDTFPRDMLIPWSQLHNCNVHNLELLDLLWVLPQLALDANVTIRGAFDPDPSALEITTFVGSLKLVYFSGTFLIDFLAHLVAPALHTFCLTASVVDRVAGMGQAIVAFLGLTQRTLKRLLLPMVLSEDDLVLILESPHLRDVVHVDIPASIFSPRAIAALGASPLPALRKLVLCGTDLDETALLAALATHHQSILLSRERKGLDAHSGLQLVLL
ncbi:hypothetical protein B0H16DRAFT_1834570 [Mycena metata]|uniref:F-box domain-containing protein n=1 Tax=Mycena metata TaxID=1033252 RepID=A0AAD7J352_9AGAR|nr:hypothetical protein B0H16DRAFT_1834570 [Mycena metata]